MAGYSSYHFGILNGIFRSIKKLADRSKVIDSRVDTLETSFKGEAVGSIKLHLSHLIIPEGWIELNGSTLRAADYPELYKLYKSNAKLNNQLPSIETFTLPDYRDRYVRHVKERDTVIGDLMDDTMQNVSGRIGAMIDRAWGGQTAPFGQYSRGTADMRRAGTDNWMAYRDMNLARSARTSDETRPKTVWGVYIIKVKN